MMESKIRFSGNTGTFFIRNPKVQSSLYLPVANEEGIKSSYRIEMTECGVTTGTFHL